MNALPVATAASEFNGMFSPFGFQDVLGFRGKILCCTGLLQASYVAKAGLIPLVLPPPRVLGLQSRATSPGISLFLSGHTLAQIFADILFISIHSAISISSINVFKRCTVLQSERFRIQLFYFYLLI